MILAGVLLKMGGYGILRICYPICPAAAYSLAWLVCGVGVLSMVYGALAAMAQKDFKRLVAYSSVSHMGYVLLGIGVWSAVAGNLYDSGLLEDGTERRHVPDDRPRHQLGWHVLPGGRSLRPRASPRHRPLRRTVSSGCPCSPAFSTVIFFAALGLPGLCGFIGEFLVVLASWNYSMVLAVVAASVVILTAGYILWTIQRVYLGPEYKGPHGEALTPMNKREIAIAVPLVVMAIVLGIYPRAAAGLHHPQHRQAGRQPDRLDPSGPTRAATCMAMPGCPAAPSAVAGSRWLGTTPPPGMREVTVPDDGTRLRADSQLPARSEDPHVPRRKPRNRELPDSSSKP